jgi:hypothetical protein
MPAHSDAISTFKAGNVIADLVDDADDLVTRYPRQLEARPQAVLDKMIAVTDATGVHSNANLTRTGFWDGSVFE